MVTTNFPRSRNRAPDETAWASIRDEFTQLYLHEGLSLKKISLTLAETRNFHAEPHMFKHRIKQWNLRKNFKLEELGAVAKAVEPFIQAGLQAPTAILDSRKVPLSRAKRHFKDSFQSTASPKHCRSKRTASDDFESRGPIASESSNDYTHNKRQRRPVKIPRIFLQHSPEMQSLESTLIQVNNYYAWRISRSTDYFLSQMLDVGCHLDITEILDPDEVFNLMEDGMNAFAKGAVPAAQALLKQFCSTAKVLLFQQHPRLIGNLIYYSAAASSTPSVSIRTSIFCFLFDLARKVLGGNHPILMIIDLLQHPGALQKSLHLLAFKVLREVASSHGGWSESVFDLDLDMVDVNAYQDDFQTAVRFCQDLLQRYVDKLGAGHLYCRKILRSLAHLHYCHDQDEEAEKLLLRVLDLDASYKLNTDDADRVSVYAMEMLGWAFEARKNFSEAGRWYYQATAAATTRWGPDHCATQRYMYQWNRVQARLNPRRVSFDFKRTDNINMIEELQQEISRLGFDEITEYETFNHGKPWDDWVADTGGGYGSKNMASTTDTREPHSPPCDEDSRGDEQNSQKTTQGTTVMEPNQAISMTSTMHTSDSGLKGAPLLSMTTSFSPSEKFSGNPSTEVIAADDFSTRLLLNSADIGDEEAFIDTLPVLDDSIDFDLMFSYLDESGDTLSNGFFSCTDFQDWYALEGQDYDRDVYMTV